MALIIGAVGAVTNTSWLVVACVTAAALAGAVLVRRLLVLERQVTAAEMRLRAGVAGRPEAATGVDDAVRGLQRAIDDAFVALQAGQEERAAAEQRRARMELLCQQLDSALRGAPFVPLPRSDDEPPIQALVLAVQQLLEAIGDRTWRWQNDLGRLAADDDGLTALPPLFREIAERLLRLTRVDDTPDKVVTELRSLATALQHRARAVAAVLSRHTHTLQTTRADMTRLTSFEDRLTPLRAPVRPLVDTFVSAPDRRGESTTSE